MTIPQELFTPESMLTLTGAAGITFVICNALQSALNFNPRWLALAIAEVLSYIGTFASHPKVGPTDYIVAFANGCLIYLTAAGGTHVAGGADHQAAGARARGPLKDRSGAAAPSGTDGVRRRFLSPWF